MSCAPLLRVELRSYLMWNVDRIVGPPWRSSDQSVPVGGRWHSMTFGDIAGGAAPTREARQVGGARVVEGTPRAVVVTSGATGTSRTSSAGGVLVADIAVATLCSMYVSRRVRGWR